MADCTSPNSSRPIGTFRLLDGTRYLKTLACDNRANSAVSHVINREMGYHKFVWKAPAETVGPVYIRATVVSTKKIFWTNITSQIIRDFSRVAMGQYCHIQQYLDLDMENNIVTETTTLDNPTTNGEERTTTSPISTSIHHDTTRHQHLLNISTNRMRISTPSVDSKAHHSSLPITLLITVFFIMVTLL
ncbi:hypothetical protein ACJMK2_041586 [Sinanodonta woodiana]|uniref:Reelin domain-containing protein n=1 Tax=Sinanodonta woodiana TaxID=1069815 RepID=A0ABD3W4S1_SINWO